jgi:hypothetical protein
VYCMRNESLEPLATTQKMMSLYFLPYVESIKKQGLSICNCGIVKSTQGHKDLEDDHIGT